MAVENKHTKYFRALPRHPAQTRVQLFTPTSSTTGTGVLHNYSRNGMYVESELSFNPGYEVHIIPTDEETKKIFPSTSEYITASVRWQRVFHQEEHTMYGMGIKLCMAGCDACGRMTPVDKLRTFPGPINLCPDCEDVEDDMVEGKLKSNMERFLMGNVI